MNGAGPPTAGMVLAGGSSYGAYEVGVMLALFHGDSPATNGRPLEVNQFSGTSVGAYNASAMVAGLGQGFAGSAVRLSQIWLNEIARQPRGCDNGIFRVRGADLLSIDCLLRRSTFGDAIQDGRFFGRGFVPSAVRFAQIAQPLSTDSLTRAVLEQLDVSALFDMSPFQDLLRRTIPLDSLLTAGVALKAIASNFETGGVSIFTGQDIAERVGHAAIQASGAVPGFFPPVVVDGAIHVDGGALMNTPLIPALQGSDTLYVAYMDPSLGSIKPGDLQSTLGIIDRMMLMFFAFSMNQDIQMIADFNQSLALIDSLDPGAGSDPQAQALARAEATVAQWVRINGEFAPTTIHRFHPTDDLGGAIGFLDFTYDHIAGLIDRGYRDAVAHDCVASGCVFPAGKEGA